MKRTGAAAVSSTYVLVRALNTRRARVLVSGSRVGCVVSCWVWLVERVAR